MVPNEHTLAVATGHFPAEHDDALPDAPRRAAEALQPRGVAVFAGNLGPITSSIRNSKSH